MSKKANPALIGSFVLIGLAIAIGGLLVLGSGSMFKKAERYVVYFDGSVAGLDVGAPVQYLGVNIGTVSEILLQYNTDTGQTEMPVYIEVDSDCVEYTGSRKSGDGLHHQIERGMRAQLQSQSMVTGKLKIMILMAPKSPVRLRGHDDSVPEVPTIPTFAESFADTVEDLPVSDIVMNVHSSMQVFAEIAQSGQIQEMIGNMNATMIEARQLVHTIWESTPALMTNLTAATVDLDASLVEFTGLLTDLRPMVSNVTEMVPMVGDALVENADMFKKTQAEIIKTVSESRKLVQESSPLRYQFVVMLDQVAEAAKSMQVLVDYLERHPEALLTGKSAGGSEDE